MNLIGFITEHLQMYPYKGLLACNTSAADRHMRSAIRLVRTPACHAGGRGFEFRRSVIRSLSGNDTSGTGAKRITAMSRHESRQKHAREFGATDIVTERGDKGVAHIKELTNGVGADSVLEMCRHAGIDDR